VLISGWFLINTRAKSFLSLFFQILALWGGGIFTYARCRKDKFNT
jgi:hypothetical protein